MYSYLINSFLGEENISEHRVKLETSGDEILVLENKVEDRGYLMMTLDSEYENIATSVEYKVNRDNFFASVKCFLTNIQINEEIDEDLFMLPEGLAN